MSERASESVGNHRPDRPVSEQLHLAGPEPLTDCRTLLGRLVAVDPAALVRLQASGPRVSVWAQPLGVVVRRDITGTLDVADRTVGAAGLQRRLQHDLADLPAADDTAWRVSLPPRTGWDLLDEVPVEALHQLAREAAALLPTAPDPAGLYDQTVLTVSSAAGEVSLRLRVVVALDRLGFLPADPTGEVARVSCTPAWARIATRIGTAYQRRVSVALGLG